MTASLLSLNGGSSSLKFALFAADAADTRLGGGRVERIGQAGTRLEAGTDAGHRVERALPDADHAACIPALLEALSAALAAAPLAAIGHRVVHGGERFTAPTRISADVLAHLRALAPFAPEHEPAEIALIEACAARFPGLPQVACFDTAFHAGLPAVARLLPIPRRYASRGVRRYGFHGISYQFLLAELARLGDPAAAAGRVVLAHLGNGASMAAVRDGRGIDTTMGFTPAGGLVMGTRPGDLDPGLVAYLARADGLDAARFDAMVNGASGLLGLSETSADVRDLLAREAGDSRAAEALAVFCYQAKKWLGALTAGLGGLDALVFSGGIGEHAAPIRARICAGLEYLGLTLDAARNAAHAPLISTDASRVRVRVIATDEELQIARETAAVVGPPP